MCEGKVLNDLEKVERQMAVDRFDWFAFRCEVAKVIYSEALKDMRGTDRQIAQYSVKQADLLVEELKKIQ